MGRGIAVGLLALAACSSPAVGFDDFDTAALAARCDRLVRCGLYADQDTCVTATRQITDQDLAAAVANGKVHYDGAEAKQCVDALAAVTCDATAHDAKTPPAACAKMLSGTIADDDACAFDAECSSGTCVPTTTCVPGACCAGTCQSPTPSEISGACQVTKDCVAGAYCSLDHICVALGVDGEMCLADVQCADDLGCITATFPGTCRALPALGAACPDHRCADIGAICDATTTCVAAGLPGAPCTTGAECSALARCDAASHLCAALPDIGMPCDTDCAGNAWCDVTTTPGTCTVPLANTSPCNADDQCASNYCAEGPAFDDCTPLPVCT